MNNASDNDENCVNENKPGNHTSSSDIEERDENCDNIL